MPPLPPTSTTPNASAGVDASAARRLLAEFRPGMTAYIQGGIGEPVALRPILESAPDVLTHVSLIGGFIPGINGFDYTSLNERARLTAFMMSPALRPGFEAGRVAIRPLPYSQIVHALTHDAPPDLAIIQVAPPDGRGRCSLGPCVDFAPLVWARAGRRIAFINPDFPRAPRGQGVAFDSIDVALGADAPFITGEDGPVSAEQAIIAGHIAALVPDGAALQTGIGGAPASALARLADRRGLRVRSGLVTQGYRALSEAGALAPDGDHVAGMAYGSDGFMRWAADAFIFADATVTHGAAGLAATDKLFAINSALEIDLFGQANVEWRGGRLVSGLGGAPDFARAARRSRGGRAILALPATAGAGKVSRIVARLDAPTVSIPRDDTDLVITEHGVADLRGTSLDERAQALIAVAAPAFRADLSDAWREMRRGF